MTFFGTSLRHDVVFGTCLVPTGPTSMTPALVFKFCLGWTRRDDDPHDCETSLFKFNLHPTVLHPPPSPRGDPLPPFSSLPPAHLCIPWDEVVMSERPISLQQEWTGPLLPMKRGRGRL